MVMRGGSDLPKIHTLYFMKVIELQLSQVPFLGKDFYSFNTSEWFRFQLAPFSCCCLSALITAHRFVSFFICKTV